MAKYIEREALIESIRNGEGAPLHKLFAECCVRAFDADVVEVVRCKDCDYAQLCPDGLYWCNKHDNLVCENSFCSYGEMKEEAQND